MQSINRSRTLGPLWTVGNFRYVFKSGTVAAARRRGAAVVSAAAAPSRRMAEDRAVRTRVTAGAGARFNNDPDHHDQADELATERRPTIAR